MSIDMDMDVDTDINITLHHTMNTVILAQMFFEKTLFG